MTRAVAAAFQGWIRERSIVRRIKLEGPHHSACWRRVADDVAAQGHALAPASAQSDTLKEIVEVIEDRHYASRRYDDGLSAQHFTAYLDALDPQRMFFEADDIATFAQWRLELDNAGRSGDLAPAFTMFNNYHDELKARLTEILATLPKTLEGFDYEVEEYIAIDHSTMPWAKDDAELDERWRKRLKNQALSLLLAEKAMEEIPETLERRYQNQLKRLVPVQRSGCFPDLCQHPGRAI